MCDHAHPGGAAARPGRIGLARLILCLAGGLAAPGSATAETDEPAAAPDPLPVRAEASWGRERYSSPLVRLGDEGVLVTIPGRNSLSGNYGRLAVSAVHSVPFNETLSLQLNGGLESKKFNDAPDLDFAMQSLDAVMRWQLDGSSMGMGPGWQRMAIGGRHFRERRSLQWDWTLPTGDGGYLSLVMDLGQNRHASEFRDLDSLSGLALIRRQFPKPLGGLDEISVEAGAAREINQRGLADLSNTLVYTRLSADWSTWGLSWSAAWTGQYARFDAPLLDELPRRRDHFTALDLSCEHEISPGKSVRLDLSQARNRANVTLYESRFHSAALSLTIAF